MPPRSKGPWFRTGRGWYTEKAGKQVFLSKDKGEAFDLWHQHEATGTIEAVASGAALFHEVMESYCEDIERTRTAEHLRGTHWRLNQLCAHWRNRPVASLRHADIQKAMEAHDWGPTTQANVLTALRGMLRWASRAGGLVPINPLPEITLPRAETRVHVMTKPQVARLLKNSPPALRTILKALADTGARPSELRRATAEDCDADGTAIRLGKGKQGRRIIFFPKGSRAAIAKLRKQSSGPLFVETRGKAWSASWFEKEVQKARTKAKLPVWATAYALRHTWITNRLRQRKPIIPIALVARMAGTSVTLIDKVYGHLSDQDLKAVADEMG